MILTRAWSPKELTMYDFEFEAQYFGKRVTFTIVNDSERHAREYLHRVYAFDKGSLNLISKKEV